MTRILENKSVVVFGATGKVGPVICKKLAEQGAKVVVHYNSNSTKAELIADEIKAAGNTAIALGANCNDAEAIKKLYADTNDTFGSLDVVVNLIHKDDAWSGTPVWDLEWDHWKVHIDAMQTHFYICKFALPYMRAQHYGRIIFVSGGLAYRFYNGCSLYSCAKAGLNAFTKTLALEEGKNGITCNIVSPGKVITEDMIVTDESTGERFNEDVSSVTPLGRHCVPEDIAGPIIFYASPEGDGITGQTIYVTGGEIMPMP